MLSLGDSTLAKDSLWKDSLCNGVFLELKWLKPLFRQLVLVVI